MKMNKEKWYAVPPYIKGQWTALNKSGELIATFETEDDCIKAVEAVNSKLNE